MVLGSKTLRTCTVWWMSMDAHEFEHHSFYLCHPLQETQASNIKIFSSLRALREWLFFTCRWSLFASWWSLVQSQKVFLDACDLETLGFIPRFPDKTLAVRGALLQCLIQIQTRVLKGKSTPTTNWLLSSPKYGVMIQISKTTTNCIVVLSAPLEDEKLWVARF